MAPFAKRFASAQAMAHDPRICVTDIEARLGTSYTADTLAALSARHPDIRFVWLMGADNMIGLPRWRRWREIAGRVPIAVYPRPGFTLKARLSPHRRGIARSACSTRATAPCWRTLRHRR